MRCCTPKDLRMRPLTKPFIENQIASKDIKPLREELLLKQEGICPLCGTLISPADAALDHCHSIGNVRMVLHGWCNSILGRVENWSKRVGKTDHLTFLKNTVEYLEMSHTDIIHPTHGRPKSGKRRRRSSTKRVTTTKKSASASGRSRKGTRKRNPDGTFK